MIYIIYNIYIYIYIYKYIYIYTHAHVYTFTRMTCTQRREISIFFNNIKSN